MRAYFGSKISPHMTKTPEGYLICHDVPVARTGKYQYLGKELGLDKGENDLFDVFRDESEVFSPKAIASFNSKPVTNDHPPDLLTPENTQRYCMGVAESVRRSKDNPDLLLADLVIYNERLIKEIENGKREVSCGYEYELIENKDGTYSQRNIVGNHIAIVDKGRAGDRCKVMDSNKEINNREEKKKRMGFFSYFNKNAEDAKDFLTSVGLKKFAEDAEPEEVMQAINALTKANKQAKDEFPQQQQQQPPVQKPEGGCDKSGCDEEEQATPTPSSTDQKLDKLIEMIGTLLAPKEQQPENQAIDEMIEGLEGKDEDPEDGEGEVVTGCDEGDLTEPESTVVSLEEDRPKNPIPGADSIAEILKVVKPLIANMEDKKAQKVACDSLQEVINKAKRRKPVAKYNSYAQILKSQKKAATDKAAEEQQNSYEDIQNMYRKMNPHYKGGDN
jgi:hypothetical protein